MAQSVNGASTKGAHILLYVEECAGSMVQSANDVGAKGVQNMLRKEECALGMGQSRTNASYAAPKGAQILR